MLDIKFIRENPAAVDANLARRGAAAKADEVLAIDKQVREIQTELQQLQSRRNEIAKLIGQAKSKGEDAQALFDEMETVGPKVKALEEQEREQTAQLKEILSGIPNLLADDVPDGADEDDNEEIRRWGEPTKFDFDVKPHYDLGEGLDLLDFETAATMSGSRFAWLQGDLARLERALAAFMLDQQRDRGFIEIAPPLLVSTETMYGTGQLPKFHDDQFETTDGRWLIPTAEVSLTNYAQGKILAEDQLPLRFCAWTPCFRKEAGSAGKDTRGLIRMHQFYKVEMVQLVTPEESDAALDYMVESAENILQKLELPYRVLKLCAGDTGFGSKRTYDLEVWLPAQETYREISSCSTCGDFQARRMNARYKNKDKKNAFLHTLNGSGLATGRSLVAVLENYQQADGSIKIPDVLVPYLGGQTEIKKA